MGLMMDTCELCNGLGLVRMMQELNRSLDPVGEAIVIPPHISEGRAVDEYPYPKWAMQVSECLCRRKARALAKVDEAIRRGSIDKNVTGFDWQDFQTKRMEHARHAVAIAQQMVECGEVDDDGMSKSGLLLAGPKGTGKSSLAYLVLRKRAELGHGALWVRFPTLIDEIRWTYQAGNTAASVMDLKAQIQRVTFLVIDELGSITRAQRDDPAQLWAEDAIQTLQAIMDVRHNLHLPTIITSNLSMSQLVNQFGDPVMSRIKGLCHIVPMDSSTDLRTA